MSRLDDYRTALLVLNPQASADQLVCELENRGDEFAAFIVGHGLGPLWHERTAREDFHKSRMQAEALFAMQEKALTEVDSALTGARIEYVVIKGAANRLLLYPNAAVRACSDIDLLVRPADRFAAAAALINAGLEARPMATSISFELTFVRDPVNVDLHWGLLRQGRLSREDINGTLSRRRKVDGVWMLDADDALFLLLVHPAFKKHLAGWEMGLHRIVDIVRWFQSQPFDQRRLFEQLDENGARIAAWATLRWVEMLMYPNTPQLVDTMLVDLQPGRMRRYWLESWLRHDLPERTASIHKLRLLGFSLFLHDDLRAAWQALAGRYQAFRRRDTDMEAFRDLVV